jgi:hypothetical protein
MHFHDPSSDARSQLRSDARSGPPGSSPRGWGLGLALLVAALWLWPLPLGLLEPWTGVAVLPHSVEDGRAEGFSRAAWEFDSARRSWLGQGALFLPGGIEPFPVEDTRLGRHHLLASLLSLPLSPLGSATWRLLALSFAVGTCTWLCARRTLRLLGAGELAAWWGAGLYVLHPWFLARLESGTSGLAWPWLPLVVGVVAQRSDELARGDASGTWRHGAAIGLWLGLSVLTDWAVAWSTSAALLAAACALAWARRGAGQAPARAHGTAPWVGWPVALAVGGVLALPMLASVDAPTSGAAPAAWTQLDPPDDHELERTPASLEGAQGMGPLGVARLHPVHRPPIEARAGFRATAPYRELSLGWGILALALWGLRGRRSRALALGGAGLAALALVAWEHPALANAAWIELWPAVGFLLIAAGAHSATVVWRESSGPRVFAALAFALAWLEFLPAPVPAVRGQLPTYAAALRDLPSDGAVLQLPWTAQPGSSLLAQTLHRRPLFCPPLSSDPDRSWKPLAGVERVLERYPSFAALLSGRALAGPEDLAIDLTRADIDLLVARRSWIEGHPELWDLIDQVDGWATEESPTWVLWYRAPSGFQLRGFAAEAAEAADPRELEAG